MSTIIGIDPGVNTGVAVYIDGHLTQLLTMNILDAFEAIEWEFPALVCLEDSTLVSHIFTAPGISHMAGLKVARNIGEVDGCCKLIKYACERLNISYKSVSPKQKGKKMARKEFDALTGWKDTSNQHERDAAMVAWSLRNTKISTLQPQSIAKS